MNTRDTIKDWRGIIIGFIETDSITGNKTAKDFYGRVLGRYEKKFNLTKDFYGRQVGQGDQTIGLLYRK